MIREHRGGRVEGPARWSGLDRDEGSATVELAAALPALVLLTIVALTAVDTVLIRLQCVDAAREVARATARGDAGVPAGQRVAPSGAKISVAVEGDLVRATVRTSVHPLGGLAPGLAVTTTAVAAMEPDASGPVR